MGPKKAAAESSTSVSLDSETVLTEDQRKDDPEVSKAMRKVPLHPSTMEMVKEALTELDQRKGVSAQAIRTFVKDKYTTVDESRLKMMVRKALVKGIDSGVFVRPANSVMTTGARGRFRLAVRKPKLKNKEAKENDNPNIAKAKTGDAKTKSVAEIDKPKKKNASASKVDPAKKPKAKRVAGATNGEPESGEPEAKTLKPSKASKIENGKEPSGKKGKKVALINEADSTEKKKGSKKAAPKSEESGNVSEAIVKKKGGKKVNRKTVEDADVKEAQVAEGEAEIKHKKGGKKAGGEQNPTGPSGKKGKKAAEK